MRSSREWFSRLNDNRRLKSPFPERTGTDFDETGTFSGTARMKSFIMGFILQTEVIPDQGFPRNLGFFW
jgi:hypothetical protein